jgi:hypothetical protein
VRQHEGHGLRVLVLQEGQHLPGVGAAQELEGHLDQRGLHPAQQLAGLLGPDGRLEHLAGEVQPALRVVPAGADQGRELLEHRVDGG